MTERTARWLLSALVLVVLGGLAFCVWGCGGSPLAPTATAAPLSPAPTVISYAINIPYPEVAQALITTYPNGRDLSPIDAQTAYDYRFAYGAPNVYYGPTAPPAGMYSGVGIVVAPVAAAAVALFHGSDWPQMGFADAAFIWQGHFTYVPPRPH